jgi:phage shock protein PspC (stress-responsive transcriptional regulator)
MNTPMQPPRRLVRSEDRMIAGVCAGLAEYLRIDPTLVRVLAVVLGLVFCPVVPIGYLIAWAIIPRH